MVLTQREKLIAFSLGGLVVALILFYGFIKPYFDKRSEIAGDIQLSLSERSKNEALFSEQARLRRDEKKMIADGLKSSQSEAKGQIRDALDQWAPLSGINEKTLNDAQVSHDANYDTSSFKLSGWGSQATIAKLINQCETTTLPLRVTKLVLNPVKEGQDYIYFELTVSTINRAEKGRTRISWGAPAFRGDQS